MRSKKPWARETNLLRLLAVLYQLGWNSCCKLKDGTVGPKMPSVADDVIDFPNKIIGCATASQCCYREYFRLCVNQTGYFRFFKTSQNVEWNRLNLWKELKQASRILDLGLETTFLKFTQLYPRHLCK